MVVTVMRVIGGRVDADAGFDLHRDMSDAELRAKTCLDVGKGGFGARFGRELCVKRGDGAHGTERPGVDMVDVGDAINMSEQVFGDLGIVEADGRA